jgi:hypothetical protein
MLRNLPRPSDLEMNRSYLVHGNDTTNKDHFENFRVVYFFIRILRTAHTSSVRETKSQNVEQKFSMAIDILASSRGYCAVQQIASG